MASACMDGLGDAAMPSPTRQKRCVTRSWRGGGARGRRLEPALQQQRRGRGIDGGATAATAQARADQASLGVDGREAFVPEHHWESGALGNLIGKGAGARCGITLAAVQAALVS